MQCEPSTTRSCESSSAPKTSAKIAKNRSPEKRWHTKLHFLADHASRKYGKGRVNACQKRVMAEKKKETEIDV